MLGFILHPEPTSPVWLREQLSSKYCYYFIWWRIRPCQTSQHLDLDSGVAHHGLHGLLFFSLCHEYTTQRKHSVISSLSLLLQSLMCV